MFKEATKLDKLKALIDSNSEKNHYLAACMLRSNNANLNDYKHLLKTIPVVNRINNLKDIFDELGESIDDIILFKEPKSALEKYLNACVLIPKIVQIYNEGWEPNWSNSERKHFPYFEKKGSVWVVGDAVDWFDDSALPGSFYYKNDKILMKSCKIFQDIYNDWLNYVK